ncbi:MAG: DUF2000 domain-containing protein [Spirochaetales bacterium]|nr:DUF2000 domain-containing protein [Spirochaetales bacterium]
MKVSIIINESLPNGLAANTAAVIGISLGAMYPSIVGEAVKDAEGNEYSGITSLVIPILSADENKITEIVKNVRLDDGIELIPFTKVAQRNKTYDAYTAEMLGTIAEDITYSGIALIGSGKRVAKYTGSLPLLS